jgi:DNA-binding LacI/PurR family transcriptional regulator
VETAGEIVLAAANFSHVFPIQVYKNVESRLGKGVSLKQVSTFGMADTEAERLKRVLEKSRPIGLICVSIAPQKKLLEEYRAAGVPVVIIDEHVDGFVSISGDNIIGGQMAAEYLVKSGRKNIAVVSGRLQVEGGLNAQQRLVGFKMMMSKLEIPFNEKNVVEVVNYSYKDGVEALSVMAEAGMKFDAIFCSAGDMCALGVLKEAREREINIPQQVALIGYDDLDAARTSKPALTTIRQPIDEMAQKAYDMITLEKNALLSGGNKITFKPELIKRESA